MSWWSPKPRTTSRKLVVERDSVCAGDDVFAPNRLELTFEPDEKLDAVLARILASGYLPRIQGGCATWIVKGRAEKRLAAVAQQWAEPKYLVDPASQFADHIDRWTKPHLYFIYWCQVDPERVFRCLKERIPLPDKHGQN